MKTETTWKRSVVEPTIESSDGPMEGTIHSHPAYAQISASRVSGGAVLYGSDFLHRGFVRIRIASSTMRRSLSNDWPHAAMRPHIEVDLSEAQWAHFVSSMNVGMGTQCTLRNLVGEDVPDLPQPVDRRDQFAAESAERMARAVESVNLAIEAVRASSLSKAKQAEIIGRMSAAERDISSNQRFVAEQFDEHMEKTTEAAKIEVNAYAMNALRQIGLESIAAGGVLSLPTRSAE
jgi:hypothetical protein